MNGPVVYNLENISAVAEGLLRAYPAQHVFALQGEMGAGKTSLITAVARFLGVKGPVGSPTYSIINEYAFADGRIFHIDLYRLRDEEEMVQAGVVDAIDSGDFCFIEWPELAAAWLDSAVWLQLRQQKDGLRRLENLNENTEAENL